MAWQVEWTQSAWNDLEIIANFISNDSPYYAAAFVQEVKEAASSLRNFAERGRVTPELHRKDIRELFIRHYRLIYQITQKTVYILTFVHGARDLYSLWKQ